MITEKDIRKLLQEVNSNKVDGQVITRPLSDTVDYANIWLQKTPSPHLQSEDSLISLTAYFIRKKGEQYIAAILAAEQLKYYSLPQYRKNNLFLDPFREVVIPHILQHKPIQRLLLNRAAYSEKEYVFVKKTALSVGFKVTRENEREIRMAIEASALGKREYITGSNTGISEKRKQEMKTEILLFVQKLKIFQTEIELKTGDIEYAEDINEIIDVLKTLKIR